MLRILEGQGVEGELELQTVIPQHRIESLLGSFIVKEYNGQFGFTGTAQTINPVDFSC